MQQAFEVPELQIQPLNVFAAFARSVDAAVIAGELDLAEKLLHAIYDLADNHELAQITQTALDPAEPAINPSLNPLQAAGQNDGPFLVCHPQPSGRLDVQQLPCLLDETFAVGEQASRGARLSMASTAARALKCLIMPSRAHR